MRPRAPPPNEWVSYRVDRQGTRLWRSEPPPQGTYKVHKSRDTVDYSDPRDFFAPTIAEQQHVWHALHETLRCYYKLTNEKLVYEEMYCLSSGYNAAWDEIRRKLEVWICATHGSDAPEISTPRRAVEQVQIACKDLPGYSETVTTYTPEVDKNPEEMSFFEHGELNVDFSKLLFRLGRWYGLIEDWRFAPNGYRRGERPKTRHGVLEQNPEGFACQQCRSHQILCYGHREDANLKCTPCRKLKVACSISSKIDTDLRITMAVLLSEGALVHDGGRVGPPSVIRPHKSTSQDCVILCERPVTPMCPTRTNTPLLPVRAPSKLCLSPSSSVSGQVASNFPLVQGHSRVTGPRHPSARTKQGVRVVRSPRVPASPRAQPPIHMQGQQRYHPYQRYLPQQSMQQFDPRLVPPVPLLLTQQYPPHLMPQGWRPQFPQLPMNQPHQQFYQYHQQRAQQNPQQHPQEHPQQHPQQHLQRHPQQHRQQYMQQQSQRIAQSPTFRQSQQGIPSVCNTPAMDQTSMFSQQAGSPMVKLPRYQPATTKRVSVSTPVSGIS